MHKFGFLLFLLSFIATGCGLPQGVPISQIDIQELDSAKSRACFYYGKAQPSSVKIVSDNNGDLKTVALFNRYNECTYADLVPGEYEFRVASSTAGGAFWGVTMPPIKVTLLPGETYYIQVAWNYDRTFGLYTNKRFNLILLDPEQGKTEIQDCLYVGEENTNQ